MQANQHTKFSNIVLKYMQRASNTWQWENVLGELQAEGGSPFTDSQLKETARTLRSFFSNRQWASIVAPAVIDDNARKAVRVIAFSFELTGTASNYGALVAKSEAPTQTSSARAS